MMEFHNRQTCFYCERKFKLANYGTNKPCAKTVDHIIPISKRGNNNPSNRLDSCIECNMWKSSLTIQEFIQAVEKYIFTGKDYKTIPDTRLHLIVENAATLIPYIEEKGDKLYLNKSVVTTNDLIPRFTKRHHSTEQDATDKLMPPLPVKSNIRTVKISKHEEKALGFYDNPVQMERDVFLARQTPEQFRLAKMYGWEIAKALTEVKPNFHEGYVD